MSLSLLADAGAVSAQESRPEQIPTATTGAVVVHSTPAGDTAAVLRPTASISVVETSGDWVRVRLEGWIGRDDLDAMAASDVPGMIGLSTLRANPDAYSGQTVRWRVQFVARQRADHLRSDMEPGAHYLLVRDPGGEPGLVYVVVPEELLSSIDGLSPLERVEVSGRVLTGRSPLTGHPILELLDLSLPPSDR